MITERMKHTMQREFRKATLADAYDISVLVNSAYRGESSRQGWTTEADLLGGQRTDPERISEIIQNPNAVILLLHSQTQSLVACVELEIKDLTTAYLGMLTVAPSLQAGGVGRAMLAGAEHFVRDTWQRPELEMKVISIRSELISWYLRRGYKATAEKGDFPANDPRFGIPKRSDLEFVVLRKTL